MAQSFTDIPFDYNVFEAEVIAFRKLLQTHSTLKENEDIRPFFRDRPLLAAYIASCFPEFNPPEQYAFEFNLFGDFFPDLAVTRRGSKDICFVEFEDATEKSLFKPENRGKPSFGKRLEHGYSQIVDWFCKLDGMQKTDDCCDRFGHRSIEYHGILIVGRSSFLTEALRRRLDWRSQRVIVNNKKIYIYTYDDLLEMLEGKLSTVRQYRGI